MEKLLLDFLQVSDRSLIGGALIKLYADLKKLIKEGYGSDVERIDKLIQALHKIHPASSTDKLTDEQLQRICDLINFKLCSDRPATTRSPTKLQIDLSKLDQNLVSVVINLINNLSADMMSSSITVPILEYFELITVLTEGTPEVRKKLAPIREVLESYGWTDGGFIGPPDLPSILKDLREILGSSKPELNSLPQRAAYPTGPPKVPGLPEVPPGGPLKGSVKASSALKGTFGGPVKAPLQEPSPQIPQPSTPLSSKYDFPSFKYDYTTLTFKE
jgi:hypothetical protein